MFHFKAHQLLLDGSLTNACELGEAELDEWMYDAHGRYASVLIRRNDGATVIYTDSGTGWDIVTRYREAA